MAASKSNSNNGRVYICSEPFAFSDENGYPVVVAKGTRYREGHPILKGREDFFKLDDSVQELPEGE